MWHGCNSNQNHSTAQPHHVPNFGHKVYFFKVLKGWISWKVLEWLHSKHRNLPGWICCFFSFTSWRCLEEAVRRRILSHGVSSAMNGPGVPHLPYLGDFWSPWLVITYQLGSSSKYRLLELHVLKKCWIYQQKLRGTCNSGTPHSHGKWYWEFRMGLVGSHY